MSQEWRSFPITNANFDLVGSISLNEETIQAFEAVPNGISVVPVVLRGLTAARTVDDQVIGFEIHENGVRGAE